MARKSDREETRLRTSFSELLPPAQHLRHSLESYPGQDAAPGRRSRTAAVAAAGIAATVAIAAGLLLVYGALDFSPNRALQEAASGIARSVLTDSLFPEEDPFLALAEDLTTAPELEIDAIHADVAGQLVAGSRSPASQ
jgi:hypothetical protein